MKSDQIQPLPTANATRSTGQSKTGSTAFCDPRIAAHNRYVRLPELRKMVPWSAATIWRQSKNPASKFPKPVKLSERVTAWNVAAVEAFLAEREAA
ncbi:hypothetical protein CY658_03260 [Variovorax sp. RO1]|uniref:helix-turn-helix transcriptional regulator n=1 Tax=Variovorax sp. RO1 TaxID=2066034 RepID=UPI000C718580|nr:AlpA family phage regulatory protein [Variovorax sp. RO1]PLC06073.1 hypothetical protein CY658_03260 [Variovorax sp. RO1]